MAIPTNSKFITGKDNVPPPQGAFSVSERVVSDLIEPLHDKGYHLPYFFTYKPSDFFKFLTRNFGRLFTKNGVRLVAEGFRFKKNTVAE